MKKSVLSATGFCIACLALLGASLTAQVRAEGELKIVVLVNDDPISAYDIVQRTRFIAATTRQQPSDKLRKQVIDDLISERIQLQEAKKLSVAVTDKQISDSIGRVAQSNNMTGDQMIEALKKIGVNTNTFKSRIKAMIAWRSVIRRKFKRQIVVSSAEVDKVVKAEKDDPKAKKTQLKLQRVGLSLPQNADQRAIAARFVEAEKLRKKFSSCENISKLAETVTGASVSPQETKTSDQLIQPARALLMKAKVGQMTPAKLSSNSVELYAVCERGIAVPDDDEKRQTVEKRLRQQEFQTLANRYLRDLRQDSYIEYR